MSARNPHIKLRSATLRGVTRRQALARVKLMGQPWTDDEGEIHERNAWVHFIPPTAKVYRVGEDAIVISDGGSGYMPFSLTALEDLVFNARQLPIIEGELILP